MFDSCSSIKSIDVSNFDTSQAGDLSYMFTGCESLGFVVAADTRVKQELSPEVKVISPHDIPPLADSLDRSASEALAADEGHTGRTDPDPR